MKTLNSSPLLGIEEAANYLCISRSSIYRLINTGEIKTVHVLRRKQVIEKDALDNYIALSKQNGHHNV